MKKLIFLAIILRVLVAMFYFHPDIKTYSYQASFLKKGVFNIYTYLTTHKKELPLKEEFVYFPLTYLTLGSYQAVVSPFLPGLDKWLGNADSISNVRDNGSFWYLLVLKLPYLVLDIAIGYLLMSFFTESREKKKVFTLWLFNPFTIVLIYIFGNVDIMPVILTVASFIFVQKKKLPMSALLLGLASGFKLYPLLFIPFLFLAAENKRDKVMTLLIPGIVLALTCLPFASGAFVNSALVSGLTTRIFSPSFSVGFNEFIIVGILGFSALFYWAYLKDKSINLGHYWIALYLLIFSFSHFHVAWLLWLAPFIVMLAVKRPKLGLTLLSLTTFAFLIPPLYEDRFMTIGLMRQFTTLYDLLPTAFQIIEKFFDPFSLQSILHSVLAGGSIVLIYKMFNKGTV